MLLKIRAIKCLSREPPIGVYFLDVVTLSAAGNHQYSLDPMGNSFRSRGTSIPEDIPKYTAQRNILRATQNGSQDFPVWLLLL